MTDNNTVADCFDKARELGGMVLQARQEMDEDEHTFFAGQVMDILRATITGVLEEDCGGKCGRCHGLDVQGCSHAKPGEAANG